jgi:hypothetical protein
MRSFRSHAALTTTLIAVSLLVSGCARHPKAIPGWGGNTAPLPSAPVMPSRPVSPIVGEPVMNTVPSANGRFTFTQGCAGSYSVRDTRTNRQIASGRAYNSGRGLVALNAQGRQTTLVPSTAATSVLFLPDCNCRAGSPQTSDLPASHQFAATPPSAAACAAS